MTHALIMLAIGNLMLLLAVGSLRRQRLKERYALLFILVGVPCFVLAAWPDAAGWAARRLGIEYQTVVLLATTTFFLLMTFRLLSIVSVQERRITTLAQMVAILNERADRQAAAARDPSSTDEPGRQRKAA